MYAPKTQSKDFEACPVGWSLGVCSRVIDLGTHWNEYKQKDQRKISIVFESQHLMKEGEFAGQPFLLFGNFNYSMYQGKAHLCTFIENWLGKRFPSQEEAETFDLATLLGKPAFMNVIRSDDGKFTNIQTIGPVPDGMTAPQIVGKTILIDQGSLDPKEVEKLSDKMKAKVMNAKEQTEVGENSQAQASQAAGTMSENPGAGLTPEDAKGGDFDDDIPFLPYGFHTVI
jgi:hypothetical protein